MRAAVHAALGLALFAGPAISQYTYTAAPCVNLVKRTFSDTDGLVYTNDYGCASGDDEVLGTSGSSGSCTRGQQLMFIQFLLPDISSSSVTSVEFNAHVTDSSGSGVPGVLYGLGPRTLDTSGASDTFHGGFPMNQDYGYPLAESEFYNGVSDSATGSVLINADFAPTGIADGTDIQEASTTLADYIRGQLDAATSGTPYYTALRISTDDDYGCDTACDGGCRYPKYEFNAALFSLTITVSDSVAPTSDWVFASSTGALEYYESPDSTTLGDKIPDFSGVGFKYGSDIPTLSEVGGELVELAHATGDQASRIQGAIDAMASHPIDSATGFRGTLRLGAGTWEVGAPLTVGVSGVVLQGDSTATTTISASESGFPGIDDGLSGPSTVLHMGRLKDSAHIGNPAGKAAVGDVVDVTTSRVPVGATSFDVSDASSFTAGDNVFVQWYATDAWIAASKCDTRGSLSSCFCSESSLGSLHIPFVTNMAVHVAVGMELIPDCGTAVNGGSTSSVALNGCRSWATGDYTIQFNRMIMEVAGNTITVDLPLTQAINGATGAGFANGGASVYKFADPDRVRNVGVREITFVSEFSEGEEDETHAWNAVTFDEIKDGFAENLLCQQFGYVCVGVLRSGLHVTTKDCRSETMISRIVGGRRYSFYIEGGSNLFTGCTVSSGRHQFISGSKSAGPNVFHDCHATSSWNDIGPHHRWATGILYDGVSGGLLTVEDRGSSGSGHGWSGASIVYWNSVSSAAANLYEFKSARIKVEAAPTTLSWSIGNRGATDFGNGLAVWESYGRPVDPPSLYAAQKGERACPAHSTGANLFVGCTCDTGYTGTIVATATSPYYSGSCSADSGTTPPPGPTTPSTGPVSPTPPPTPPPPPPPPVGQCSGHTRGTSRGQHAYSGVNPASLSAGNQYAMLRAQVLKKTGWEGPADGNFNCETADGTVVGCDSDACALEAINYGRRQLTGRGGGEGGGTGEIGAAPVGHNQDPAPAVVLGGDDEDILLRESEIEERMRRVRDEI